jgi:hypothetical protein
MQTGGILAGQSDLEGTSNYQAGRDFRLRGTDAGQAFMEENRIDLSLILFMEEFEDAVENTLVHEAAIVRPGGACYSTVICCESHPDRG